MHALGAPTSRRNTRRTATPRRRFLGAATAIVLALGVALAGVATAPPASAAVSTFACDGTAASDQNGLRVTPSHGRVFYIDSGQGQSLDAAYAAYQVTDHSGAARRDLWVTLDTFTGGVVALANPTDATQPLAPLTANGSATAFTLLKATSSSNLAQAHVVHVYQGRPGTTGATEVYRCSYAFSKVAETIKAAANKVTNVASTAVTSVGSTVTVTVQGNTGTIGQGDALDGSMMWFSPAARSSWPTSALRLESTQVRLYSNNGRTNLVSTSTDQLRIGVSSGSKYYYTAVYTFRVIGSSVSAASVIPVAQISSGTQIKHTDVASITSSSLATDTASVDVAVTKAVRSSAVVADGWTTLTYDVTFSNRGPAVSLDTVTDQADEGLSVVPGSVTFHGAAAADPASLPSGGAIFSGPFALPAGTSGTPTTRILTYRMTLPTCSGTFDYANSATASIGALVVGSDPSHYLVAHAAGTCGSTTVTPSTSTMAFAPEAVTLPAEAVTQSTARLVGTVDPNGAAGAPVSFRYGTDPTLASGTTVSLAATTSATSPYAVTADVSSLTPGTVYYVRVSAGTASGAILSFVTPEPVGTPTVTTEGATGVTSAGAATFTGSVDPNQVPNGAKAKFQYALDSSGGLCSSLGAVSTTGFVQSETDTGSTDAVYAGAFPSPTAISLTGLTSGARYCYRAVTYFNASTADWSTSVAGAWMPVLISTKTAQSITFPGIADSTVGQSVTAGASASSGLTVQYSSSTPDVCEVAIGGALTLRAAGTCALTASQPGSDSYSAALPVTVTFQVARATQSITFAPSAEIAAGESIALDGTASSGLTVTYSAGPAGVCSIESGRLILGPDAGECTVTASQAGNDGFLAAPDVTVTITVTPGPPVVTTTALPDGVRSADYSTTLAAAGGAGSYGSWTVSSGELPPGLHLDPDTGVISGTPSSAGSWTFRVTVSSEGQSSVEQELTLVISKPAPSLTVDDLELSYGDDDTTLTVTTESTGARTFTVTDPAIATVSAGVVHVVGAGSTTVRVDVAESAAHSAASVTATITVARAILVVTAPNPSVTYGDAAPTLSPEISGWVNGDDETDLESSPICSSAYTSASAAGSNPAVLCLDAAGANYEIRYVDGAITIARAAQRLTVSPESPSDLPPGGTASLEVDALGDGVPEVSTTGPCTWSAGVLTAGAEEGECVVTVTVPTSTNHGSAGPVTRTLQVRAGALLPRTLTLDLSEPGDEHSMLAALRAIPTVGPDSPSVTLSVAPSSAGVCEVAADGTITLLGPGECVIRAAVAADATYAAAEAEITFTVSRVARTLSLTASPSTQQTGGVIRLVAIPSAGGGTVSYALADAAGHCSIAADLVTAVSVGTCDVVATIPAAGAYRAATSATLRLVVTAPSGGGGTGGTGGGGTGGTGGGGAGGAAGGGGATPTPTPTPSMSPAGSGSPTGESLGIEPLGRLPLASPDLEPEVAGAPPHSSESVDTCDVGEGPRDGSASDLGSAAERSLTELAGEQLRGFAPGSGVRIDVVGARTVAQFVAEPSNAGDVVAIDAAIAESRARLAAEFAALDAASPASSPDPDLILGGRVTRDARDAFLAAGLGEPLLAGDLPVGDATSWVSLEARVDGYRPGSVVYLAVTTQPVILAATVVDREGSAVLRGLLPADLLPAGGHDLRVVGSRVLGGVGADADGTVVLDAAATAEIQRFDDGTRATVTITGANATGGQHEAVRIILLGLSAPWWTVLALGALALVSVAALAIARPRRRRWHVLVAAVLVSGVALPGILGWQERAYDVVLVGALVGLLGAALSLAALLLPRRAPTAPPRGAVRGGDGYPTMSVVPTGVEFANRSSTGQWASTASRRAS